MNTDKHRFAPIKTLNKSGSASIRVHPRPGSKNNRGQSLVEFAVSLVILLLLVVVIMDGARALFTYLSMRDAAQEGALYASVYPPYDPAHPSVPDAAKVSDIENRVCKSSDMLTALCNDGSLNISVTPTVADTFCMGLTAGAGTHAIAVRIDYPSFPLTMPFVGAIIGSQTVPITVEVIDTILSPKCP